MRRTWLFGKFLGKKSVFQLASTCSFCLKARPAKPPKPAVWNQGTTFNLTHRCISALLKIPCTADTTNLFKIQNLNSSNSHSTQSFVVIYVYVLMHALPGIVDGARKTSQGGSWIWVGASLPMFEATTSREQQCMSAVTSTVLCIIV